MALRPASRDKETDGDGCGVTVHHGDGGGAAAKLHDAPLSKTIAAAGTWELFLYIIPLALAYTDGIRQTWSFSREYAKRVDGWPAGQSGLHPGWLFGLKVDLKDACRQRWQNE